MSELEKNGIYRFEVEFNGKATVEISVPPGMSTRDLETKMMEALDSGRANVSSINTYISSILPTDRSEFGVVPRSHSWYKAHFVIRREKQSFWIDHGNNKHHVGFQFLGDFIPLHVGARVGFNENENRKVTCASALSHDIAEETVTVFDHSYGVITTSIDNITKPTTTPEYKKCLYESPNGCCFVEIDGTVNYHGFVVTKQGLLSPKNLAPYVKGLVVFYGKERKVISDIGHSHLIKTTDGSVYAAWEIVPVREGSEFIIEKI